MNRICDTCGKEFMCKGMFFKTCPISEKYEDMKSCSCENCNTTNKEERDCGNIPFLKIPEKVTFT